MTSPDAAAPFDAFLSYHSGDEDWVATLKTALEAQGIRVWLDAEQIRPGDRFPGALARAIGSVRCVVLVLSPGSVRSRWVEEEYHLALARGCHVLPVIIDDVDPPGFMAGRTWVDFRDESQFTANLDQLIFGITGSRRGDAAAVPAYREEELGASASPGADEAEVLKRLIQRRRQDVKALWLARIISAIVGLALGGLFLVVAADTSAAIRAGVCILAPLILSLAAWGATMTGLARLDSKVEQFQVLSDGLEACRSRSHPGCRKLRQHFWVLMEHMAIEASAPHAERTSS